MPGQEDGGGGIVGGQAGHHRSGCRETDQEAQPAGVTGRNSSHGIPICHAPENFGKGIITMPCHRLQGVACPGNNRPRLIFLHLCHLPFSAGFLTYGFHDVGGVP